MFHLSLLARFSERTFLFYVGSDSHDANCPLWNVPNESQITILQSAGPQKLKSLYQNTAKHYHHFIQGV